jgi:flagellar hook assembly protein FlgD
MIHAGSYSVTWDGTNENGSHAPFGTYVVLFKAGNKEEVRKIMLIKPY